MAITFVQQKKTQKYLILAFGALILIIVFVFFSDYFKEGEEIFIGEPIVSKHLSPIKIDFQVLENPIFQKLSESFPDLPSVFSPGEVGRENPFLPYEEEIEEGIFEE